MRAPETVPVFITHRCVLWAFYFVQGGGECGLFYGQDMAPISCVAWRKFIPILLPSVRFSN